MYKKKFFKSPEPSSEQKKQLLKIKKRVQELRDANSTADIIKKKLVTHEITNMLCITMAVSKHPNTDNNLKIAVLFMIADIYACSALYQKNSNAIKTLEQLYKIFKDIENIYETCTTPDVTLIASLNNWGISDTTTANEHLKTEIEKLKGLEESNQDQTREYIKKIP